MFLEGKKNIKYCYGYICQKKWLVLVNIIIGIILTQTSFSQKNTLLTQNQLNCYLEDISELQQFAKYWGEEHNFEQALLIWEESKMLCKQAGLNNAYVIACAEQAKLSSYLEQWEQVLQYVREGFKRKVADANVSDSILAQLHFSQGEALTYLGQFKPALAEFQQTKQYIVKKYTILYLQTLATESYVYYYMGDFVAMKNNLEAVIELIRKNKHFQTSEMSIFALSIQGLLGTAYDALGQYDDLLDNVEQTLKLATQNPEVDTLLLASLHHNLGAAYSAKGNHILSLNNYNTALLYYQKYYPNHDAHVIETVINKMALYKNPKQFQEGLKMLFSFVNNEMILEQLQKNDLIDIYTTISVFYKKRKQYDLAQQYLQKALPIAQQEKYKLPTIYKMIGDIAYHKQEYSNALTYLKQAEKASKLKVNTYYYRDLYNIHRLIGRIWMAQKKFPKALAAYQKALFNLSNNFTDTLIFNNPTLASVSAEPIFLEILQLKAEALYQQYQHESNKLVYALATSELACTVIDEMRRSFQLEETKQQLASQAMPIYEQGIKTALALYEQTQNPIYQEKAFYFSEKGKATILLEGIQDVKAKQIATNIPDSLLTLEETWHQDYWFYRKKLLEEQKKGGAGDSIKLANWQKTVLHLEQNIAQLKKQLELTYPSYYKLKYTVSNAGVSDIQKMLATLEDTYNKQKHALLSYFVGDENTYVFYLTPQKYVVKKLEATATIRNTLHQLTQQLYQDTSSFTAYTTAAHQAYQQLLAPLEQNLQAINALIIVPDDQISYIPFEALLDAPPSKKQARFKPQFLPYLLKKYAISYAYSGTLWLEQMDISPLNSAEGAVTSAAATTKGYLAFAPTFEATDKSSHLLAAANRNCNGDEFSALTHSKEEVTDIHKMVKGSLYTDVAATKANFLASATQHQILHLATHACVDDAHPMFSRIQFVDTALFTHELFNLDLKQADLAVLSACETGTGILSRGEGVMSLSRAFAYGGCPSLVQSLWNANDASTAHIMKRFYQQLETGISKPKALQQAKLTYLNDDRTPDGLAHPFFWATFIQSGNTHQISIIKPTNSWYWWLGGSSLLLLLLLLLGGLLIKKAMGEDLIENGGLII